MTHQTEPANPRPKWTDAVFAQRRSVGTLQWGFRKRPKLAVIAIILLIQAIVVATVAYFNASVSIPIDLLKTVDVNVLPPSVPPHPR